MRKKFTMLFAALTLVLGSAWAQPEEGKMYRLKENTQGLYLTIAEYNRANQGGTQGSVPLLAKSLANNDQIWYFEATGTANQYNVVSKSGYYLFHHSWNVLAYNTEETKAIVEIVDNGDGTFKIKNGNTGTQWYKSQNVGGTWHPFCDAGEGAAATWALEEVDESEFAASEEYTALLNLITVAETLAETVNANIGTAIGEYSQATATALATAIASAKNLTENEVEQSDVDALQAAIDAVAITLPTVGKYYQFHSAVNFAETKAVYSDGANAQWKTCNNDDKSFYWKAVATDGGVALQNAADEKYLQGWTMGAEKKAIEISILTKEENEKGYQYGIFLNGGQMHANWHSNGAGNSGNIISYSTGANNASAWYIVEVELPEFYTITYNFNYEDDTKYTQTSELKPGVAYPAMNISLPYGVTSDFAMPEGTITADAVFNFALTVNKALPFEAAADVKSINTWYYVQMHTNKAGYLGDIAGDNSIDVEENKESDGSENFVWGFAGNVFDGIIVVNKGTGLQLNSTGNGNATLSEAGTAFFVAATSETSENATYGFCLRNKNSNNYVNANYTSGKLSHWGSTDAGSTLFATECDKEYAVEVSAEAGYATYYSLYRLAIPETVKAYVVAETNEGNAVLEQVTGVLPARTGVILEGEGTHTFVTTDATAAAIESNKLQGSIAAKEVTVAENEVAYILAEGTQGVGLYKAALTDDKFTNGANKAYMIIDKPAEGGAAPAMFSFGRGEGTTGIEQIVNNENVVIYDLAGRRVQKMEKGIYIVNGKKVIR